MINALRSLDIKGNGTQILWMLREKGITLFSVLPQTNDQASDTRRSQMIQYEATHDNHLP